MSLLKQHKTTLEDYYILRQSSLKHLVICFYLLKDFKSVARDTIWKSLHFLHFHVLRHWLIQNFYSISYSCYRSSKLSVGILFKSHNIYLEITILFTFNTLVLLKNSKRPWWSGSLRLFSHVLLIVCLSFNVWSF